MQCLPSLPSYQYFLTAPVKFLTAQGKKNCTPLGVVQIGSAELSSIHFLANRMTIQSISFHTGIIFHEYHYIIRISDLKTQGSVVFPPRATRGAPAGRPRMARG